MADTEISNNFHQKPKPTPMKPASLFLLAFCFVLVQTNAQDVLSKFGTEFCACLQRMKPETITTSVAVEKELALCYGSSIVAHQKELKKRKIIDFDNATEEEMTNFWAGIFKNCPESGKAAYGRIESLQDAEAEQSFQGVILYLQDIDVSGSLKKMGLTKEMMLEEIKKEGSWADTLYAFYRLGNYARIGNNKEQSQKIYNADENTIYSFSTVGNGICSVQEAVDLDLSGEPDKPIVTELDSTATIMGLPCKIIRVKWELSQIDYYYNTTQAQVDPDLFSKHSSEGFSEFVNRTKCLPLQTITTSMGAMVIQTAIDIRPAKIETDMFAVPELVEDESLNILKLPGIKMMRIKE